MQAGWLKEFSQRMAAGPKPEPEAKAEPSESATKAEPAEPEAKPKPEPSEPATKPESGAKAEPSEIDAWVKFVRDFRASGNPEKGLPADKAFIDSLYEDE